jgi:glycosyltransferase involved in cell wall biosynthesis
VRPLRILHITESTGGVETYLRLLFEHIDRERFEFSLVCPAGSESLIASATELGVAVHPMPLVRNIAPLRDLRCLGAIVRAGVRLRPDVIHAHSSKAGVLGRVAGALLRVPRIYTPNAFAYLGHRGAKRRIYLRIERLMRPFTTVLLAVSDSERARAIQEVGFRENRVECVPNAIDVEGIGRLAATAPHTDQAQVPLVLMVGRLAYQKNPEMFARVAALVTHEEPSARFRIIGAGFGEFGKTDFSQLVQNLSLEKRLAVVPWVSRREVSQEIARADIVVMPSRYEGLPYVALESQALAKPLVVTRVDGLKDVVLDGTTGYVIDLDDDRAMARVIVDLIRHPHRARILGEAGRERVRESFNITTTVRKIAGLYQATASATSGNRSDDSSVGSPN